MSELALWIIAISLFHYCVIRPSWQGLWNVLRVRYEFVTPPKLILWYHKVLFDREP